MPKMRTETFTEPSVDSDFSLTIDQRSGVLQVTVQCAAGRATWNPAQEPALLAHLRTAIQSALASASPRMGF